VKRGKRKVKKRGSHAEQVGQMHQGTKKRGTCTWNVAYKKEPGSEGEGVRQGGGGGGKKEPNKKGVKSREYKRGKQQGIREEGQQRKKGGDCGAGREKGELENCVVFVRPPLFARTSGKTRKEGRRITRGSEVANKRNRGAHGVKKTKARLPRGGKRIQKKNVGVTGLLAGAWGKAKRGQTQRRERQGKIRAEIELNNQLGTGQNRCPGEGEKIKKKEAREVKRTRGGERKQRGKKRVRSRGGWYQNGVRRTLQA